MVVEIPILHGRPRGTVVVVVEIPILQRRPRGTVVVVVVVVVVEIPILHRRPGEGAPLPLLPFPPSVAVSVAAMAASKLASFLFGKFCNKPTADEEKKNAMIKDS